MCWPWALTGLLCAKKCFAGCQARPKGYLVCLGMIKGVHDRTSSKLEIKTRSYFIRQRLHEDKVDYMCPLQMSSILSQNHGLYVTSTKSSITQINNLQMGGRVETCTLVERFSPNRRCLDSI